MNRKYENLDRFIYILLGVFLAGIFEFASRAAVNTNGGSWHGLNFNLVVYMGSLVAAFAIFSLTAFLIEKLRAKNGTVTKGGFTHHASNAILYGFYTIVCVAIAGLIYRIYINECNLYPGNAAPTYLRQEVNHRVYFIAIFAIAAALFFTLPRLTKNAAVNRPFRIVTACIWAVINGIAVYCPNIFLDKGGGQIHVHAVTNSMINVAQGNAFDQYNCSIYGHYGLLTAPIVKLLGGDLYAVMQTLAIVGVIAFLAGFYVADKLIRHDAVFLIAVAGMTGTTTILTRRGQYFQINPLRLLFPCLILAVLTFAAAHREKRMRLPVTILEILVGVLSVIWNFETGLFTVAIVAFMIVFRGFYTDAVFTKATLRRVILAVIYAVGSILCAYGLVNLYNIAAGGSVNSFRLFIYPLMSGTYNVNNLRLPLPSSAFLYVFETVLFFLTLVTVLRKQYLRRTGVISADPNEVLGIDYGKEEAIETVRIAIALSGLSSLIYFMNRAAYGNMSIAHIQTCLLLATYGESSLILTRQNRKDHLGTPSRFFNMGISALLFACSVWMAIEGAMYIIVCYDYRANSSWQTQEMNNGIEQLRAQIPMNTFAFGTFVPEVYAQLGWDTGIVMTDWSDMNDVNREFAYSEAMKRNQVLTTDVTNFKAYTEGVYAPTTTVEICGLPFQLFERIESLDENALVNDDLDGAAEGTLIAEGTVSGAESVVESVAESVVESVAEVSENSKNVLAVVDSAAESVAESVAEPVADSVVESVAESTVESMVESVASDVESVASAPEEASDEIPDVQASAGNAVSASVTAIPTIPPMEEENATAL